MTNRQKDGSSYVRCPGQTWADILDEDAKRHDVPAFLYEESIRDLGSESLSTDAYVSPEYFKLECEKMWPHVWQFAAREEDIPNPGEFIVYENVGKSFLISRQDDGSVKAFYNVCLHRGRKLRTEPGTTKTFVCPFHGFTWNKNGGFMKTPCDWDFPHVLSKDMSLPEARVTLWEGYILINEDENAEDFESWAAPLPEHFKHWHHADSYTAIWVGKIIKANWKVCSEAFMEAWHSATTHPQIVPYTGDANTRYDIYGDHVNRALTPFGVMSPHLQGKGLDEQYVADEYLRTNSPPGAKPVQAKDGMTARQALAEESRKKYAKIAGRDYSHLADGEFMDALVYNVFPNFAPWGGHIGNIIYRFRPWPDQDTALMEVRILLRNKPGETSPPTPEMFLIEEDEPFSKADHLLGAQFTNVFQQDMDNLPFVQDGMKSTANDRLELGNYQEIRIRHFHQTMQKYFDKY